MALLQRALAEAAPDTRADVLADLGDAATRVCDPAAADHLAEALAGTDDPRRRGEIALSLARALTLSGDGRTVTVLDGLIESLRSTEPELAMQLEAQSIAASRLQPAHAGRVASRLAALPEPAGCSPGERALLACLAAESVVQMKRADRVMPLVRRAVGDGRLLEDEGFDSPVFYLAVTALTWADLLEPARRARRARARQCPPTRLRGRRGTWARVARRDLLPGRALAPDRRRRHGNPRAQPRDQSHGARPAGQNVACAVAARSPWPRCCSDGAGSELGWAAATHRAGGAAHVCARTRAPCAA